MLHKLGQVLPREEALTSRSLAQLGPNCEQQHQIFILCVRFVVLLKFVLLDDLVVHVCLLLEQLQNLEAQVCFLLQCRFVLDDLRPPRGLHPLNQVLHVQLLSTLLVKPHMVHIALNVGVHLVQSWVWPVHQLAYLG